jgi:soluble lytic murein transglycosylase-like protein
LSKTAWCRAGRVACAAALLSLSQLIPVRAEGAHSLNAFPELPLPPAIDVLIGLPQTYTKGRRAHLALVTRVAEEAGLPPAVADAVAQVESAFNPTAVGGVGEIGLMQVRPETAAMLGHRGGITALFEPEINVRFGVMYLARAWQLADGDLCRALMKYRAGWGEERMTPLSVEYCRRARGHLASIGSPLANGALPTADWPETPFSAQRVRIGTAWVRSAKVLGTPAGVPRAPQNVGPT